MKILNFDVLTSCPKDELHQWFIGLYGEHIVPAIVYRYTQALQRPDLVTLDKNGEKHPLVSNEAVARVFKRLADRLQGVVTDTSTVTITPEYDAHFLIQQALTGDRNFRIACELGVQYPTLKAMQSREDHI